GKKIPDGDASAADERGHSGDTELAAKRHGRLSSVAIREPARAGTYFRLPQRAAVTRNDAFLNHEVLMLRSRTFLTVLLLPALAACGASRSPVPVVGAATDVSSLTGEWAGEYSSVESGRSGSITFTLRSAGDTAFGD